jgi:aminoglycoside phosphotransferase (APT) family kinase protein
MAGDVTDAAARIAAWLERSLGLEVRASAMTPLRGGGIQENWTLDAVIDGEPRALVVRKDAPATISSSHSRRHEFQLLQVAHRSGVTVPEPLAFCDDVSVPGAPFVVMAKVSGVGLGQKVVKDLPDAARLALTERLARELASIHAIKLDEPSNRARLDFLPPAPADFARAEIARLDGWLAELGLHRPGLAFALRWCERHIPRQQEITLIHSDFRTGNYMVADGGLTAVLDWEFATLGDPMFDIGWFHAACWRFGRQDLEAGGVGGRKTFYRAYEEASGRPIDHEAVKAYETLAHCRWAVIALQQGERHWSGREPSLDHALTGAIAEELELAALRMTAPDAWIGGMP